MDQTTNIDYRKRLLPFVERWVRRETRVAIFGTGPHTEFLYDVVPELNQVRIVGYLDSNKERRVKSYRSQRIHPPDWAESHADVILCSSFVNEASMAAAVEHIGCKILTSHTPLVDGRGGRADNVEACRLPSRLRIPWADPMSLQTDFSSDPAGMLARYYRQVTDYLSKARVLDSILDECFPFVRIPDKDTARVILRYVLPKSRIFEIRAASVAITRLSLLRSGHGGKLFAVQPRYGSDPAVLEIGSDNKNAAGLSCLWMKGTEEEAGQPPQDWNLTWLRRAQRREDWWEAFNRAVAGFITERLRSVKTTSFIRIDDEGLSLKLLRALEKSIEKYSPTLLFKVDESRWGLGFSDLFRFLEEIGYDLMCLEQDYRKVNAMLYNSGLRSGFTNILAVRAGRARRAEAR